MKYILQFGNVVDTEDFTYITCAMFGAIVSATDPVAVVALLKELGVSSDVSTLIEGESLLNDGTAMVMFLILLEFVKSQQLGTEPPSALDIGK